MRRRVGTHRVPRYTQRWSWPVGGPPALADRSAAPPPGGRQTPWLCWGSRWGKVRGSSSSLPQPGCFSRSAWPKTQSTVTLMSPPTHRWGTDEHYKRGGKKPQQQTSWNWNGAAPILGAEALILSAVQDGGRVTQVLCLSCAKICRPQDMQATWDVDYTD